MAKEETAPGAISEGMDVLRDCDSIGAKPWDCVLKPLDGFKTIVQFQKGHVYPRPVGSDRTLLFLCVPLWCLESEAQESSS
jgi:hypothetical protein